MANLPEWLQPYVDAALREKDATHEVVSEEEFRRIAGCEGANFNVTQEKRGDTNVYRISTWVPEKGWVYFVHFTNKELALAN